MYPQRIFALLSFLIVPQIVCASQPEGESKGVCEVRLPAEVRKAAREAWRWRGGAVMIVKKMAVAAGKGATATTPGQVGAANPTEAKLQVHVPGHARCVRRTNLPEMERAATLDGCRSWLSAVHWAGPNHRDRARWPLSRHPAIGRIEPRSSRPPSSSAQGF
jgi:hypothetical protein